MNPTFADIDQAVPLQGMLGYLNFGSGKPDARFEKQLNDVYGLLTERGAAEPWQALHELLRWKLDALQAAGAGAFRDTAQARAVLALTFDHVLPAYRQHHADLLFHLSDRDLFQPFFLARVFEAVLLQGSPWDEQERTVSGALAHLNDYVGYRPVAVLENRPRGEPYDHERVRPIPLYVRGAGVAVGRYQGLISRALDLLAATDPAILAEAGLDLDLLDELALDPRAYDQGHPVNRRPNYIFGEWDPHHLDSQGRFRRYVARQVTLDALAERAERPGVDRQEALFESAAVFAGTLLMAVGTTGPSPTAYDSSVTLATLMPRVAGYRDTFYARLLETIHGPHGDRLRQEAEATHQPFGGARQYLNQYLARHRAAQLQQRHLAVLFAEMGYPDASRQEADRIPAATVRLLSRILGRLSTGQLLTERGELAEAARLLPEAEDLLHRGIACGALADPWNILGFQGLFPLSAAREESVRDPRVGELIHLVEHIFHLYSRLISEAAAVGRRDLCESLLAGLKRLAAWWDQFASVEVGDVPRVHGGETAASAEHVAHALTRWHDQGERTGDLAFWRDHLEGFHAPKAFALVVEALLRKEDYRAAMALLVNWLAQVEQVPLEEASYSFHTLALRWMLALTGSESASKTEGANAWPLVRKFFDYLEANAEEYWHVPSLQLHQPRAAGDEEDDRESLYGAAYEEMTYRDSTDDDNEGAVIDGGEQGEFDLEVEAEPIGRRLRFLSTLARLWQVAARQDLPAAAAEGERRDVLAGWLATAAKNQEALLSLLDAVHAHEIPQPLGSYDSLLEYDRRRMVKEQLLYVTIATCLDHALAIGALEGVLGADTAAGRERPAWEPHAIRLEQALLRGDVGAVRELLPAFVESFRQEPLLFTALADGGEPRQVLRVRLAQTILRALAINLPRLGLLHETYDLLRTARRMELTHPPQGRGVTEFNQLFQAAYQSVVEAAISSAVRPGGQAVPDQELADLLETLSWPFMKLWVEHSQLLQLSVLETVGDDAEWEAMRRFIRSYGADLFHARFMTLANLRGVLHRGVGPYLEYLRENPDPLHPVRLLDDLGRRIARPQAERWMTVILQALVENYEEYKDYNTTTPQSDYGQNLHVLLDFLRLKASYDRHAWQSRPVLLAHEVLLRQGKDGVALLWQQAFATMSQEWADQHVEALTRLEKAHGVVLRTVSDRLQERFVRPLAVERLCALVEPAVREARQAGARPSFERLQRELHALAATPVGVGLDVPTWLRQLEQEVQRVSLKQTALVALAEDFFRIPRKTVPFEQLRAELKEWAEPLKEE